MEIVSPLDLLRISLHEYVRVYLKNTMVVTGRLIGYDERANLLLRDCRAGMRDYPDEPKRYENMMLRCENVKFLTKLNASEV